MYTTSQIKQLNKQRIRNLIRDGQSFTKQSLSRKTGLSISTCGTIIKELLQANEINYITLASSTGGRPSKQYVINKEFGYILQMYFRQEAGYLSMHISIKNLTNEAVEHYSFDNDYIRLIEIQEEIEKIIAKYPILIISLGVPGVVERGFIKICAIKSLADLNLKNILEKKYNIPCVIENDVNMASLGYYKRHQFNQSFAYLYFPLKSHPGAGFIINDEIYHGYSNFTGEVSFMPVGYPRPVQGRLEHEDFLKFVSNIVNAIECTINPKTIVISSLDLDENAIDRIKASRLTQGPIAFVDDFDEYYLEGLYYNALKGLQYLK